MYGILVLLKIKKSAYFTGPSVLATKIVKNNLIRIGKMFKPIIKIMKL